MLEKVKHQIVGGEVYYLVTDFYHKATQSKRALTTLLDKLPIDDIIYDKKRGRGAACYSNINGLKSLVSKLQRFPLSIKQELGVVEIKTSEQEFEYVLEGFLIGIGKLLERQVLVNGFSIDFVIGNIAIEFQESHHKYDNDINKQKYDLVSKKYKLMFFNSNDNIGYFLSKLIKEIQ